jgi:hypothetical protein
MNIKTFIKHSKVATLPGNAFKFLLELYALTNKDGIIENFTILGYVENAKKEKGQITGRNTIARFIDDFETKGILTHDRYSKKITFKELK